MACKDGNCTCGKKGKHQVHEHSLLNGLGKGITFPYVNTSASVNDFFKPNPEPVLIRFRNNKRLYYQNNAVADLKPDDWVAVIDGDGYDIGTVMQTGERARKGFVKNNQGDVASLMQVLRRANDVDIRLWLEARKNDRRLLLKSRTNMEQHNSPVIILDATLRGDGKKLRLSCRPIAPINKAQTQKLWTRLEDELQIKIEIELSD